jgi:hypothetical protein
MILITPFCFLLSNTTVLHHQFPLFITAQELGVVSMDYILYVHHTWGEKLLGQYLRTMRRAAKHAPQLGLATVDKTMVQALVHYQ